MTIAYNMQILLLALILVVTTSCNSQQVNLNGLNDCLDKKHIPVMEKGLLDFESKLSEKYVGLGKEEVYINFLTDFIRNEIPPEFFLDLKSKALRTEIKETGIWKFTEESPGQMENEIKLDRSEPEKSAGVLTLKNEFQQCLISKVSNEGIKNFLALRTKVPNLSWGLTTKFIYDGITETDLKDKMNRFAIAYGIYYEFGLNLEK